jgi:hypothetical protein
VFGGSGWLQTLLFPSLQATHTEKKITRTIKAYENKTVFKTKVSVENLLAESIL